ncbi:hypothetical protein [Streptomyces sp. C36]|uniref:hypothetical protein n=1 Tax=Streptomyces sp. C36 TaxID=3237122 RepID=UPI0034C63504
MQKLNSQGEIMCFAGWKDHHKLAAVSSVTGAIVGATLVVRGDSYTNDAEIAFGVILVLLSVGLICLFALRGWMEERIRDAVGRTEHTLERARTDHQASTSKLERERNTLHESRLEYMAALRQMQWREEELTKAKAAWELDREAELIKAYALGLEHANAKHVPEEDAQPAVVLDLQQWKSQRAADQEPQRIKPHPRVVKTDDPGCA